MFYFIKIIVDILKLLLHFLVHCHYTSALLGLHLCSQFIRKKSHVITQQNCVIIISENNMVVYYSTTINNMEWYSKVIGHYRNMLQRVMIFFMFKMRCLFIEEKSRKIGCPIEGDGCFLGLFIDGMWCNIKCTCKMPNFIIRTGILIFAWHVGHMKICVIFCIHSAWRYKFGQSNRNVGNEFRVRRIAFKYVRLVFKVLADNDKLYSRFITFPNCTKL